MSAPAQSVVGPWGRFLLRLTAIAMPFLTYWLFSAASPRADANNGSCTRTLLELVLMALVVPAVVTLVYAVNTVGDRQRWALAIAGVLVAAWCVVAVVTAWLLPATTCTLFTGD